MGERYQLHLIALSRRNGHFQHDTRDIDTAIRGRLFLQFIQRIHHRHRGAGHEQRDVLLAVRIDAFVDCRTVSQAQGKAVDLIATAAVLAREIRAFDADRHRLRLDAAGFDAVPPCVRGKQAVPAFQSHEGLGAVEGERLRPGDASGVLCQGFGEGVDRYHKGARVLVSAHSMFAPNDVCIAGDFKTERGIVGHGIGSGEQYQGHFIADDGLGTLDQLLADTQALVVPADGQVREIAAIRMVGQRPGQSHKLAIHPCRQQQARRGKHARDSRELAGGPLDAGVIEHANDVHRIKRKVMTVLDSDVFHWFTSVRRSAWETASAR